MTSIGCVSLSPRRTGDADFPRPALLKTLASGMHSPRKTDQPQLLQVLVPRCPLRRTKGPLTWASQAPRLIFPRALPPTTPESPAGACLLLAHRFSGFILVGGLGHSCVPIEADSGSFALRLASLPIPMLRLMGSPIPRLLGYMSEQAIYTVNSFQFTRSARLALAYRP